MHIRNHGPQEVTTDLCSSSQPGRRAAWLLRVTRELRVWALRWHETRTAEAELASMSDRMLADVGMARCEVIRAVCRRRDD